MSIQISCRILGVVPCRNDKIYRNFEITYFLSPYFESKRPPRTISIFTMYDAVLNQALRHEDVVGEPPVCFIPGKRNPPLPYPLQRRLSNPQSRSGRGGEGTKSHHCSCRESNLDRRARSLVCILTELLRFPFKHTALEIIT
jgi:hypothetical protein